MKVNNLFVMSAAVLLVNTLNLVTSPLAIAAEEKEVLYWVAPMDVNYRRDKPGKSPMGMDGGAEPGC